MHVSTCIPVIATVSEYIFPSLSRARSWLVTGWEVTETRRGSAETWEERKKEREEEGRREGGRRVILN